MGSKGLIFSLESALAVFVLMTVLITLDYFSLQAEKSPYAKLQIERMGKDALAVMDADGTLHSGNRTLIETWLNESLPQNTSWRLTLKIYQSYRNGTTNLTGFNLAGIAEYGQDAQEGSEVYTVSRHFVNIGARITNVTNDTRVMNYSIARMEIWRS